MKMTVQCTAIDFGINVLAVANSIYLAVMSLLSDTLINNKVKIKRDCEHYVFCDDMLLNVT